MLYNSRRGRGLNEIGSLYERLLSQGEAKGRQEGRRETWDAAAAFMKENGIPVEMISKFKNSLTESWA